MGGCERPAVGGMEAAGFAGQQPVVGHLPHQAVAEGVGAGWGVGHITLPKAPSFRPGRRVKRHPFAPPLGVKRGDWIGTFELGSTVVLFTPLTGATALVSSNDKVKYGQPVFHYPG